MSRKKFISRLSPFTPHIIFAPKYRRQIVCGKIKADVGRILRTLCEQKKVEIIETEACPDHILRLFAFRADTIIYSEVK